MKAGERNPAVTERRKKVAELMKQGLTGREIERKLKSPPNAVHKDIKIIKAEQAAQKTGLNALFAMSKATQC